MSTILSAFPSKEALGKCNQHKELTQSLHISIVVFFFLLITKGERAVKIWADKWGLTHKVSQEYF